MSSDKDLNDALDLFDRGRYADALILLMPFAIQGVASAQACVGVIFQLGLGVDRNVSEAFRWLKEAARQGSGVAAHNLGTLYQTCEPDFQNDIAQSEYWYERARELGFAPGSLS